jgi:hypothetical protein
MSQENTSPDAGLYIGLGVVLCAIIVVGAPMLLGPPPLPSNVISTQDRSGKPVEIDAAPPSDTTGGALKVGQSVVDILEARLHAEPQNEVLVKELAVAYNSQAARQEEDAELALDSLWRSYALDPGGDETVLHIDKMLLKSGQDPTDFDALVKSGDAQAKQACLYGAFCQYSLALNCKPKSVGDAQSKAASEPARVAVAEKLAALKKLAEESSDDNINGAFYLKVGGR